MTELLVNLAPPAPPNPGLTDPTCYYQAMRWSHQVGVGLALGALLICLASEARACDASAWTTAVNDGPCLVPNSQGTSEYAVINTCDEPVTLTEVDCGDACSATLNLEPSQTGTVKLRPGGHTAAFRYEAAGEEFTLRFEYQENICPSEDGCSVARGRHTPHVADGLALLVLGLGFWARRGSARQ